MSGNPMQPTSMWELIKFLGCIAIMPIETMIDDVKGWNKKRKGQCKECTYKCKWFSHATYDGACSLGLDKEAQVKIRYNSQIGEHKITGAKIELI